MLSAESRYFLLVDFDWKRHLLESFLLFQGKYITAGALRDAPS
jgi:hypothetical protein